MNCFKFKAIILSCSTFLTMWFQYVLLKSETHLVSDKSSIVTSGVPPFKWSMLSTSVYFSACTCPLADNSAKGIRTLSLLSLFSTLSAYGNAALREKCPNMELFLVRIQKNNTFHAVQGIRIVIIKRTLF